jgi:hypothetical protein
MRSGLMYFSAPSIVVVYQAFLAIADPRLPVRRLG